MILHPKKFWYSVLLSLLVIAADQLSKWYMLDVVRIWDRPPIEVTSFLNLVMVWNHGVSFGMFAHHRAPLLLTLLALLIVGILLRWLMRTTSTMTALSIGFIIGGAIGNVIDRLRFEAVADFLDFHLAGYHWPAFNVADSAIFVGVVILCIESMMRPTHKDVI